MQTTYFDIKPEPNWLEKESRKLNNNIAIHVSLIGKKIKVNEPFYISKTCYFAGLTLVHPNSCQCDEEYEAFKGAK